MKQRSKGILFLWALIVVAVAGGTFLICEHLGVGAAPGVGTGRQWRRNRAPMRNRMRIPISIHSRMFRRAMMRTTSLHPRCRCKHFRTTDIRSAYPRVGTSNAPRAIRSRFIPTASSQDAACKIEVSAFPFAPSTDVAGLDRRAHRRRPERLRRRAIERECFRERRRRREVDRDDRRHSDNARLSVRRWARIRDRAVGDRRRRERQRAVR